MSTAGTKPTRGYPLIALFLVVTACGVIAALVSPVMRGIFEGRVGTADAIVASVVSALSIMLLGAGSGLFHYHRGRGFLLGILTGGAIGTLVGPITVAPLNSLGTILGMSVGGSIAIVLVAIAFRMASRSSAQ